MRSSLVTVAAMAVAVATAPSTPQDPPAISPDEKALCEYAGVYQWNAGRFLYLQPWSELTGSNQLVAFDESGDVRALYRDGRDRFVAGPGAAVPEPVESRIEFQRDAGGSIVALTWRDEGAPARTVKRAHIELHEDVRFSNGNVQLAGTLIKPRGGRRHPAIVLVHASGAASREQVLPFARFLIRQGVAVLGYDKRGVANSTGDWNAASFDDLAGDVVAAFDYLKARRDVDSTRIGLLGWSQAGWVMPLAAVRARGIAFLISVSGAGVTAAETTIDQAQNEMTARGMKPEIVSAIVAVMKLQYEVARTGQGWDAYASARDKLAARIGPPPDTLPGTRDHPYWEVIRRLYFHDPAPVLRRVNVPVLALFGELDDNIVAEKNRAAWDASLRASGHPDYTLEVVPKANHVMFEARIGSNAEMPSLRRFAPAYVATVRNWLGRRSLLGAPMR